MLSKRRVFKTERNKKRAYSNERYLLLNSDVTYNCEYRVKNIFYYISQFQFCVPHNPVRPAKKFFYTPNYVIKRANYFTDSFTFEVRQKFEAFLSPFENKSFPIPSDTQ